MSAQSELYKAASKGDVQRITELLADPRIDVNHIGNGGTALYEAARKGHIDAVKVLLADPRIDVNKGTDDANTPLHAAISSKSIELVKLFLADERVDVNAMTDITYSTPLRSAIRMKNIDIIQLLLENPRVNVNEVDSNGHTYMYYAVYNDNIELVKLLLSNPRTDVNKASRMGDTPLLIAGYFQDPSILIVLLSDPRIVIDRKTAELAKNGKLSPDAREIILKFMKGDRNMLQKVTRIWNGFTRSDVAIMDTIFDTEVGASGERPPAENWSVCPVCLKYVERSEACKYMKHSCRAQGGYYNNELYNAFKYGLEEYIEWCTICGRICAGHYHYQLAPHNVMPAFADVQPGANAFSNDCILEGGGGLKEKLVRYRTLRREAKKLNKLAGKITEEEAYDRLVHAAWDAPLAGSTNVNNVMAAKKWNISAENFPPNVVAVTAAAAQENAPNVVRSAANVDALKPILHTTGENAFMGGDGPFIQFRHRQEDGTINYHADPRTDLIGQESLVTFIKYRNKNFAEEQFGYCWSYPICKARLYPDEIKGLVPDAMYEEYRKKFNKKFRG
jgi:hypothetical protein